LIKKLMEQRKRNVLGISWVGRARPAGVRVLLEFGSTPICGAEISTLGVNTAYLLGRFSNCTYI
jgi:hypothetical protein